MKTFFTAGVAVMALFILSLPSYAFEADLNNGDSGSCPGCTNSNSAPECVAQSHTDDEPSVEVSWWNVHSGAQAFVEFEWVTGTRGARYALAGSTPSGSMQLTTPLWMGEFVARLVVLSEIGGLQIVSCTPL